MSNGNIVKEIRILLSEEGKIPPITRDRLMLAAIADIYSKMECLDLIKNEIHSMKPWINLVKWIAGVLGAAILMLLFAMLTHSFSF